MLRRRWPGWLPPLLVGLAIIAAFFYFVRATTKNTGRPATVQGGGPINIGARPPDFTATAFDGSTIHLAALRQKAVLINFFASWCVECRAEIPDIEAVYRQKQAAGFEVIGVDALENGDGQAFFRELGATFPAVADPLPSPGQPGAIARAYGVDQGLPVSVFLGRDGRVASIYPGRIDRQIISDELKRQGIS